MTSKSCKLITSLNDFATQPITDNRQNYTKAQFPITSMITNFNQVKKKQQYEPLPKSWSRRFQ